MASGLKKSNDEVIDQKISEEVLIDIPKPKDTNDKKIVSELNKKETVSTPGHTRRDFRN